MEQKIEEIAERLLKDLDDLTSEGDGCVCGMPMYGQYKRDMLVLVNGILREFAQSQAVEALKEINNYTHPYPTHIADIQQNNTIRLCEQIIKKQFDLPL